MLKNGFVHAAVTAATIATFLAAEADKKNIQQHSSRQNKKQHKNKISALKKLKYKR
jgi:membrane-anchored glycerophosphoryl diester phosphodiesterase (GDPDase)